MVVPTAMQARRIAARFLTLPPWVLFVQWFLALAWARAAIAHGLSAEWWSGVEVQEFIVGHEGRAIGPYGLWLDHIVQAMPVVTSVVVVGLQVLVALLLLLNLQPVVGLGLGLYLNANFLLAGQVNPSVFYVVSSLALLAWRLDSLGRRSVSRAALRWVTAGVGIVALSLVPAVRTVAPATVIEDPAIVLIFISVLIVATLWMTHLRQLDPVMVAEPIGAGDEASPIGSPSAATPEVAATTAAPKRSATATAGSFGNRLA